MFPVCRMRAQSERGRSTRRGFQEAPMSAALSQPAFFDPISVTKLAANIVANVTDFLAYVLVGDALPFGSFDEPRNQFGYILGSTLRPVLLFSVDAILYPEVDILAHFCAHGPGPRTG